MDDIRFQYPDMKAPHGPKARWANTTMPPLKGRAAQGGGKGGTTEDEVGRTSSEFSCAHSNRVAPKGRSRSEGRANGLGPIVRSQPAHHSHGMVHKNIMASSGPPAEEGGVGVSSQIA